MYHYQKNPSKIKKIFSLIILMGVVSGVSIFLYDIYAKIDIKNYPVENEVITERISLKKEVSEKKGKTIEEAANCIVGISKIKNAGASIFNINSTSELGLGSGFIISDNGYIITNWHLVKSKYSSCYITLSNGKTYSGNVVWGDKDLDLSIVKIPANGLDYLNLSDSDNIKLGERVYAIGNPIRCRVSKNGNCWYY